MKQIQIKYLLMFYFHELQIYKLMGLTFFQFRIKEIEIVRFIMASFFQLVIPTSLESLCLA